MGFAGFNNKKRSTLGGDFDGDGVRNRRDCQPMNFRKQGAIHDFAAKNYYGKKYNQLSENEKRWIEDNKELLLKQMGGYS